MSGGKLLIYLLRRDLRVVDNPILTHLASSSDHGFTHLLPVYIFPCEQIEISGFLKDGEVSPFPKALSKVGKFWRCGPHRAEFIAQSVWNLRKNLESLNSGLVIRVGHPAHVLEHIVDHFQFLAEGPTLEAVWMTEEVSHEEVLEQEAVEALCLTKKLGFRLWTDEKYFIDDRDTKLDTPSDLPDIFTNYLKSQEPLHTKPRQTMSWPENSSIPPFPDRSSIPPQQHPFLMPDSLQELTARLLKPLDNILSDPPEFPQGAVTAHPFKGGETAGRERVEYLIKSGSMTAYKTTRNNLLGQDYSTKLGGYLALGCISARYIHEELEKFEEGTENSYNCTGAYGRGENAGTYAIRYELLWRDYMRLCTKKYGHKLFLPSGFRRGGGYIKTWNTADENTAKAGQDPPPTEVGRMIARFLQGTTGLGLVDASQRELFLTGYTSNRARQNVASFFCKHLGIDWRYGAEWYESMLIDYDVSSNWANWQYVAGVGIDPRGDARIFNPVKQAFDYDKDGRFVRTWLPELNGLERLENLFQASSTTPQDLEKAGLVNNVMATNPIKRIAFTLEPRFKQHKNPPLRWVNSNARGRGNVTDNDSQRIRNGHMGDPFAGVPRGPQFPRGPHGVPRGPQVGSGVPRGPQFGNGVARGPHAGYGGPPRGGSMARGNSEIHYNMYGGRTPGRLNGVEDNMYGRGGYQPHGFGGRGSYPTGGSDPIGHHGRGSFQGAPHAGPTIHITYPLYSPH